MLSSGMTAGHLNANSSQLLSHAKQHLQDVGVVEDVREMLDTRGGREGSLSEKVAILNNEVA